MSLRKENLSWAGPRGRVGQGGARTGQGTTRAHHHLPDAREQPVHVELVVAGDGDGVGPPAGRHKVAQAACWTYTQRSPGRAHRSRVHVSATTPPSTQLLQRLQGLMPCHLARRPEATHTRRPPCDLVHLLHAAHIHLVVHIQACKDIIIGERGVEGRAGQALASRAHSLHHNTARVQ